MSPAVESGAHRLPSGLQLSLFALASILVHALVILVASRAPSAELVQPPPLELEIIEASPPPPEPEATPPIEEKPPIRVARVKPLEKPPEPDTAPPPPLEEAKTPTPEPPPLIVGVTLSSTTTAGGFAAPVGNTAYGAVERTAPDAEAKPYAADRYAPVTSVDSAPELLSDFKPPYPEEARRAGVEGRVTLRITVDDNGTVTSANVLSGIGYGLDEAARTGILKSRFKPAIKAGRPIATVLTYVYRFELP
ncbi:MAG: TonB family protein [Myxococcaceae bacterium]